MDKIVQKIIPDSEYRYVLMNEGFEPYRVTRIQFDHREHNIHLTLELDE